VETVPVATAGWLERVDARAIGESSVALGAGRASKTDKVDHAVGLEIHHKVGDRVEDGAPLFTVHASDVRKLAEARQQVLAAHSIIDRPCPPLPLFY
jgi:pyrimidine-nucleoside phosphorylase